MTFKQKPECSEGSPRGLQGTKQASMPGWGLGLKIKQPEALVPSRGRRESQKGEEDPCDGPTAFLLV